MEDLVRDASGSTGRGTGQQVDVDVMEGEGEGESFMNSVDLYFNFFALTLGFFNSSLSFLDVTFKPVPLPQ